MVFAPPLQSLRKALLHPMSLIHPYTQKQTAYRPRHPVRFTTSVFAATTYPGVICCCYLHGNSVAGPRPIVAVPPPRFTPQLPLSTVLVTRTDTEQFYPPIAERCISGQ